MRNSPMKTSPKKPPSLATQPLTHGWRLAQCRYCHRVRQLHQCPDVECVWPDDCCQGCLHWLYKTLSVAKIEGRA